MVEATFRQIQNDSVRSDRFVRPKRVSELSAANPSSSIVQNPLCAHLVMWMQSFDASTAAVFTQRVHDYSHIDWLHSKRKVCSFFHSPQTRSSSKSSVSTLRTSSHPASSLEDESGTGGKTDDTNSHTGQRGDHGNRTSGTGGQGSGRGSSGSSRRSGSLRFTNQLESSLRNGLLTLGPGPPPALGVMEEGAPEVPEPMTIPLEAEVKATALVKLAKTPEEEAPAEPEAALIVGVSGLSAVDCRSRTHPPGTAREVLGTA